MAFTAAVQEFAMHRGTIGCGVSKMRRLLTNHNACLQILIFIGDPARPRFAATLLSWSSQALQRIFVAFNAASSSAVLAAAPGLLVGLRGRDKFREEDTEHAKANGSLLGHERLFLTKVELQ
ncbi:hypothetical protein HBI04_061300 [Parastagonospora nodorum]|nr:hypothetical protein HBI03_053650 [Parastagonospora nodorum]KAH4280488.1 hypothetical protein HBI04_061300 [Parastagonospora nodorum]